MKNTLLILLLSAAASQAQPSGAEPPVASPNSVSNREDALRQALHQALESKAPLVAQNPVSNAPASPAPLPAPGAAPAAVPPPVIPAPATPVVVTTNPTTNSPIVVTTNAPLPSVPVVLPAPAAPGAVPIPIPTATPTPAAVPGAPSPTIPPRTIPAVPAPTTPAAVPAPTAPAPAVAVPAPAIPEEIISAGVINFQGADIKDVLTIYAELVNRTILRPTQLPAPTITLKTQTPLTKKEAVQALDAVLGMNGIAMVNIGEKFVKAVPLPNVGQTGAPRSKATIDQLPDIGPFVTHVVQLKYAKPTEMVAALQPFASPIPNPILPIDSSQILILRDFSENVKRMLEMVADIDVAIPSEYDSQVIPIKYALASEIASALNSLSSGGGGATVGGGVTGGAGGTRSTSGSRFGTGSGGYNRPGGSMGYPGQTQPGYNPTAAGANPTTPGAPGSSFTDRLQNIIRRASVTGDINVIGQTKIIADERTNSLLIFATKEDMKIIKDIVAKLDIVLAQVLIEAVVLEVDISSGKDLGISYLQRPVTSGNFSGIGAIGKPFFTPGDFAPVLGGATNTAAALKGGFSYLATFGDDLDVSVTALANDSRAKILQRPRIQTSHAVQATLFVGESRPYPTASYYGGGAYGSYSSIQQLQIGVTLDVTPLINPDGLVVMDIHQTIENYAGFTEITGVGQVPNTTRKEAAAKVAVRDHDTIMLGGLIETTKSKTGSGVPFLMDIPLLGYLFRSTSASEKRTELIVLIRPTVLPTPEIAALTAKAEKDKMPGVRGVEDEIRSEEQKRLKQADKERKNY